MVNRYYVRQGRLFYKQHDVVEQNKLHYCAAIKNCWFGQETLDLLLGCICDIETELAAQGHKVEFTV